MAVFFVFRTAGGAAIGCLLRRTFIRLYRYSTMQLQFRCCCTIKIAQRVCDENQWDRKLYIAPDYGNTTL